MEYDWSGSAKPPYEECEADTHGTESKTKAAKSAAGFICMDLDIGCYKSSQPWAVKDLKVIDTMMKLRPESAREGASRRL
jgi:hypothetical protein